MSLKITKYVPRSERFVGHVYNYDVSRISLPKNVLIFLYGDETKQTHIDIVRVSYNINALRLLHEYVSAKLVSILREMSTKDVLQKLYEPMHIYNSKF